jgi:uncharacterized Zn-binding protein involved in type VI secretion
MPLAARVTDKTSHPGVIAGPGVVSVLIGKKPASVVGDTHTCGFTGMPPHPPSPLAKGSRSVLIGGRGALRVGDSAGCTAMVIEGAPDVQIGD